MKPGVLTELLCKFSLVAKNTWRHKHITNPFTTNVLI